MPRHNPKKATRTSKGQKVIMLKVPYGGSPFGYDPCCPTPLMYQKQGPILDPSCFNPKMCKPCPKISNEAADKYAESCKVVLEANKDNCHITNEVYNKYVCYFACLEASRPKNKDMGMSEAYKEGMLQLLRHMCTNRCLNIPTSVQKICCTPGCDVGGRLDVDEYQARLQQGSNQPVAMAAGGMPPLQGRAVVPNIGGTGGNPQAAASLAHARAQ